MFYFQLAFFSKLHLIQGPDLVFICSPTCADFVLSDIFFLSTSSDTALEACESLT